MIKKIIITILLMITITALPTYATESADPGTNIPVMSMEEFTLMMQAKGAKVEIIKKNNKQITSLKTDLKNAILEAAEKVNNLRINISADKISDEVIIELRELLEFLQEAKSTLELDAQKISDEINEILDLISTKGMQLDQYDLLIEKQNTVIVKMKEILTRVNEI